MESRKAKLRELIDSGQLTDEEALVAFHTWRVWARDDQLAPAWNWRRWMILAGRGWGKTRTLAEFSNEKAEHGEGPGHLVARTGDDIEKVMINGPAGIVTVAKPWFRPIYEPSKRRVTWPNGMYALAFSAEEPDQLRGPQCAWAWADEMAAWRYLAEAYGNLIFGLRLGANPQLAIATTPRPLPLLRELMADRGNDPRADGTRGRTHITRGATRDNQDNLSREAIEDMERKYKGTRLGRQELEGEILDDVPGALWTREMIEQTRPAIAFPGQRPPPLDAFERIVVGVDPSGSDGERGDFIGIIAAGKLHERAVREFGGRRFAILADLTCQERPEEWAKRVIEAFDVSKADRIVAERNFGGDMVRALIQAARPHAPVDLVTASRGKHVRAEPVSLLYERKEVFHAEPFELLEDEFCLFTPTGYKGEDSPNRADAGVWALSALAFGAAAEVWID